jgi:hypothetical protein
LQKGAIFNVACNLKSDQISDSIKQKVVKSYHIYGILISIFFSIPFLTPSLEADEVFVVFSIGPSFTYNLSTIWSLALYQSEFGWDTGRFVSPLFHVLSNFGVALTYKLSLIIPIDVIASYGIFHVILTVTIIYLFVVLNINILNNLKIEIFNVKTIIALYIFININLIVNHAWGAGRISIWSYHLGFIVELCILIGLTKLCSWNPDGRKKLVRYGLFALNGIVSATTYELTQVMFPMSIWLVCVFIWQDKRIKEGILSLIILLLSFIIPFSIIRYSSFMYCSYNGCYGSADIKINSFQLTEVFERAVSSIPAVSLNYGKDFLFLDSRVESIVLLVFFSLLSIFIYRIFQRNFTLGKEPKKIVKKIFQIILFLLIGIFMMSLGMSFRNVEFTNEDFGKASIDTLVLNVLTGGIIFFIFILLKIKYSSNRILPLLVASYVFLIGILGFSVNMKVTELGLKAPGVFLQQKFAGEILSPDLTSFGNSRRCSYITQKINEFPEWAGHDKSLVFGLNLIFKEKFGIDFCTTPSDRIFSNYKGGE